MFSDTTLPSLFIIGKKKKKKIKIEINKWKKSRINRQATPNKEQKYQYKLWKKNPTNKIQKQKQSYKTKPWTTEGNKHTRNDNKNYGRQFNKK